MNSARGVSGEIVEEVPQCSEKYYGPRIGNIVISVDCYTVTNMNCFSQVLCFEQKRDKITGWMGLSVVHKEKKVINRCSTQAKKLQT